MTLLTGKGAVVEEEASCLEANHLPPSLVEEVEDGELIHNPNHTDK